MRSEFDKCNFCKSYDEYEGCECGCFEKQDYEPVSHRLIDKAKEKSILVSDVIALINMMG